MTGSRRHDPGVGPPRRSPLRRGSRSFDPSNKAAVEQFTVADLYAPDHPNAERTLALVNSWILLTTVLNELAHSMGQPDFYPFVMSRAVLRKLHFIYLVVKDDKAYTVAK